MSRKDEQWAFLLDVADLIKYIEVIGFTAVGGELKRSYAEQCRKFDAGLSKAKGGQSLHEKLQAIDIDFFDEEGTWLKMPTNDEAKERFKNLLSPIGAYWESLDEANRWGGFFTTIFDPFHFERNT